MNRAPQFSLTKYQTLGVPESASAADIESAFKRLAAKWHPDRAARSTNEDGSEWRDPFPEMVFRLINDARETLSDPTLRAEYDAWLKTRRESPTPAPKPPQQTPQPQAPAPRRLDPVAAMIIDHAVGSAVKQLTPVVNQATDKVMPAIREAGSLVANVLVDRILNKKKKKDGKKEEE